MQLIYNNNNNIYIGIPTLWVLKINTRGEAWRLSSNGGKREKKSHQEVYSISHSLSRINRQGKCLKIFV